jgi:hypothetical protein
MLRLLPCQGEAVIVTDPPAGTGDSAHPPCVPTGYRWVPATASPTEPDSGNSRHNDHCTRPGGSDSRGPTPRPSSAVTVRSRPPIRSGNATEDGDGSLAGSVMPRCCARYGARYGAPVTPARFLLNKWENSKEGKERHKQNAAPPLQNTFWKTCHMTSTP